MTPRPTIPKGAKLIDAPAYSLATVAHHLVLPEGTVRYWALGKDAHRPVIKLADEAGKMASFRNLIELHVLGAVRRRHQVQLPLVRKAVDYLRREFGSEHPLSDEQMSTAGGHLFVKKLGQLINVTSEGQLAMESLLAERLKRIERDDSGLPIRLFPFTRLTPEGPRSVMIDPRVQFGRPCITGTGVPTAVVLQRFKGGESLSDIAADYDRKPADIEEALRYETDLQAA